jgi:hypothetical protein
VHAGWYSPQRDWWRRRDPLGILISLELEVYNNTQHAPIKKGGWRWGVGRLEITVLIVLCNQQDQKESNKVSISKIVNLF